MNAVLNVLLVEDSPNDVALVLRALQRSGYHPDYTRVENAQSLNDSLRERPWDIVLCDYNLPSFSGAQALRIIRDQHGLDVPFIFVSGAIGEETAVDLMKGGAQDYVSKNNLTRLVAAIERELGAAETRRKKRQTEERLNFEQNLLRQFMAGTPDAIYFKDLCRRYIHLNEAECLVLDIKKDVEALGKTEDIFISAESDRTRWEEEQILAGNQPLANRIEKFVRDGATRWYSTGKVPIRDQGGAIIGLVGVRHDITDHKRHEQMKDEFIATVNHELRTPLTSIAGALDLFAKVPGSGARLLEIARSNCRRLIHLVNDILDIEKIESGKMIFDLKPLEIHELVERAIEANRDLADYYGVSVRLDGAAARGNVRADFERLMQGVRNILSNAVKFSPRGSDVIVMIEHRETNIRVSVRDHGPGIPDEYRHRIFDKFVQVDATDARQKGGTGLGLSIVREIVTRLNGEVHFETAPGGGTVFYIELPRHEGSMSQKVDRRQDHETDQSSPYRSAG